MIDTLFPLLIQLLANFLRINVYLTMKVGEEMLWNIALNDAGAEYDPLTLLRSRTMFGRPDWMSIYGNIRQAIETGQYLPGSTAQLKTKVSVRYLGYMLRTFVDNHSHRPISVVLVDSQRVSRQLVITTAVRTSSSLLPRFDTRLAYLHHLTDLSL